MDRDGFIDRQHRFSYLLGRENARRIAADPALLRLASDNLERFSKTDPRQRDGYRFWRALLDGPHEAVVSILAERSAKGDYARETAPVFRDCRSRGGLSCYSWPAHQSIART